MTAWNHGPLTSFDVESTGLDTRTDRIVTAALIRPNGQTSRWLSDLDGATIPAEATRVHSITTDHAHAHGRPAKEVVEQITAAIAGDLTAGAALVAMNAPFDLSILDSECARYGVPTVADCIGRPVGPVIDPLVLDRAADRYRKGRRTLEDLAKHYRVPLTAAHSADADALAALGVARAIAEAFPELQVDAERLHGWQVTWHARWAAGYGEHLSARGNKKVTIDGSWPVRTSAGAVSG